jgi:DNA-binding MarR family transcriptional regulator
VEDKQLLATDAVERAMVALRRRMSRRSLAQAAGVAGGNYDVLDVLEAGEEAGRPSTVSTIAGQLRVDQPRASRLVAAAVDAGWVRRVADQADGRRALLERTDDGRAVSAQIHRFRRMTFAAAMSTWSDADQATFARLLTSFVVSLDAGTGRSERQDEDAE